MSLARRLHLVLSRDSSTLPTAHATSPGLVARWLLLALWVTLTSSACQAYDRALLERLTGDSAADAAVPRCDGGLPMCGTQCVDLLSDLSNCGRCGQACTAGQTCDAGRCVQDAGVDAAFDAPMDAAVDAVALDTSVDSGFDATSSDAPADAHAPDASVLTPPGFRSVASATLSAGSGCCLLLNSPSGSVAGDLLVASISMGVSTTSPLPVMTPPPGWTLVRRVDISTTHSLWIFWHVAGASEPANYDFATDRTNLGGVGWITAYTGVDLVNPIDSENGQADTLSSTSYATPSITTVHPQTLIVATIMGHGGTAATWTPPAGMVERVDINDGTTRSGESAEAVQAAPGVTGMKTATASMTLGYSIAHLLALAPAP